MSDQLDNIFDRPFEELAPEALWTDNPNAKPIEDIAGLTRITVAATGRLIHDATTLAGLSWPMISEPTTFNLGAS